MHNPSWKKWQRYGSIARRDAHQMLEWGYRDARRGIRANHDEADITGLIVSAIKRRLSTTAPARFNRYSIADDSPQGGAGRTGIRRRRVDIIIETTTTRPRLHYIFEAKRLQRGSHTLGTYLGKEGLLRFLTGVYANEALEAAMVGYVQNARMDEWETQLKDALAGIGASLISGPEMYSIIPDLPHTLMTTHRRESLPDIVIFHVLLDCRLDDDGGSSSPTDT